MLEETVPTAASPEDLTLALYEQRRRVERLRQQVYADGTEEAPAGQLSEELLAAEETLARLEQEQQAQAAGPGQGLLYDSLTERGGPAQKPLGRDTTGVEASLFLRMAHIPTAIVHLFEPQEKPLVSVKICNTGRLPARLRVSSWVEAYSAAAVNTLELRSGEEKEIHQLPVFFAERLHPVSEITRASLRVHIQHLAGETEMERSFPVWLLARTTAYLEVRDPQTGKMLDLAPYLAAWVTPNAPQVMELLRRAVDLHPARYIAGYDKMDAAGVEAQVKAIFDAVKQAEIQYVNSLICFGQEGGEFMQRIRLPRESLEKRSANCIDGTLLMASVLEAASLNPAIVLVPGHAFLAWEKQKGSQSWDYLETTLIGTKSFEEARKAGRTQAEQYQAKNSPQLNRRVFRLLSIPMLRVCDHVMPME